ncbi:hypothetical protein J2Y69_000159 [Microbacterium resistens]|uniref:DUF2975 domain-containing protein n=1 Tax=Microbacterium resistens TaxID=156977 RepID=A0ABU1S7I9_9MICO|nr:DUF2975 domain-containing protein [Microbacterium resistens]MDR6865577.1 hypothetical protein [Microbacterium resistens]
MPRSLVPTLKAIIAIALAGSLTLQVLFVPYFWMELGHEALWGRIALVIIAVLGIATLQVCGVCIWRLLTLVRRGSVFSPRSFRYVDVIIGAIGAAAVLALALAVLLAPGATAPGVVGLLCGAALVIAGVALVVVVMRALLAQAVSTDVEARHLRAEMDEVI